MSELSDALRRFADEIDRGKQLPGATQCVVVLADESGQTAATYIGRLIPAQQAGIHLLARGIMNFNQSIPSAMPVATTKGSTH